MILGLVMWFLVQVTSLPYNDSVGEEQTNVTGEFIKLEVRAEKEELEVLANQFLKQESQGSNAKYTLHLRDEASLSGSLQLFGVSVPFELDLTPYVMEGGNLQLKATGISLGSLKLPISFVMSQIKKQLKLPEWITVHPESQFLIVHFNEFTLKSGIRFSMEQIDLVENDIRVNVFVPKENVPETK